MGFCMSRFLLAAAVAFALPHSPALAKTLWGGKPRPYLEARPTEEESDAAVRAACMFDGLISLRLGAVYGVGKGNGEPVSVRIESDGKSARVQGLSRKSPDIEMTGGTELATELPLDDAAIGVLFSGKAVSIVTPDQKKHPLVDADASGTAKKFLDRCRGG
jgi:hypothetical protein